MSVAQAMKKNINITIKIININININIKNANIDIVLNGKKQRNVEKKNSQ